MKKIVKIGFLFSVILVFLYPAAWIAASLGLFGDVEFGYYGEFNVAKHAIQKSGCAEIIEYSGVNKDVFFLEEFHFKVTTTSGRVVRLWFDASNMDVSRLCYKPIGLSVTHPEREPGQLHTVEGLEELLGERGIRVNDLRDILCNIDMLEQLFRLQDGDANTVREGDSYCWDYLRIEFPTEEKLRLYRYIDNKGKDVMENLP